MTTEWKVGRPVRLETSRFQISSLTPLQALWHTYPWTFDSEVMHSFGLPAGTWTRRSWYRRFRKSNNRRKFVLGIRAKHDNELIGLEIANVNSAGVAALSVLIGHRDWWGKGVVQEVRSAVIDFLFDQVGCSRVWGTPSSRNFPSIFNYQKLGFTCEGILRQHGLDPATKQHVDFVIFSMLRRDWKRKCGERVAA
ncbi:MAG TPA: GNAT family protein [Hyphomicrobiaceae bacterium]